MCQTRVSKGLQHEERTRNQPSGSAESAHHETAAKQGQPPKALAEACGEGLFPFRF
jgi:hypothetical protein